jgi:hypothetical protein
MKNGRPSKTQVWKTSPEILGKGRTNRQVITGRKIDVNTTKIRDMLRTTEDKINILDHPTTKTQPVVINSKATVAEIGVVHPDRRPLDPQIPEFNPTGSIHRSNAGPEQSNASGHELQSFEN